MASQDALKPFEFHGVSFSPITSTTKQAKALCIFCDYNKPVFHVNTKNQLWDCKHCGKSGNLPTFFSEIHARAIEQTTTAHYRELVQARYGITLVQLRNHRFARDTLFSQPRWLIPIYNAKGNITNLRVWQEGHAIMGTTTMDLTLWRLEHLKPTGPIYLVESEWDALALERLRKKCRKPGSVICTPGARTFKEDWKPLFTNREVYLLYDHDNAGYEGMEKTTEKLTGIATSINRIQWPSTTADGWDIRDYVHQCLDKEHRQADISWEGIMSLTERVDSSHSFSGNQGKPAEPLPVRKLFKTLLKDFEEAYHVTDEMRDALAISLATTLSIQLCGDPLWVYIVGPSGAGKTLLLEAFMRYEGCIFKSSLTPKSLISGFITNDGIDPSLIPRLQGKTLILKDFTEIMTMNGEAQEEIYGILRGAYDGFCEKTFGNGLTRSYPDCHFAMVAGVTDAIHGHNHASLGERFLKYQLVCGESYDDSDAHIRSAISGMPKQAETEKHIRSVTAGFLCGKPISDTSVPAPRAWVINRLVNLTQLVAYLRATVSRIGRDEITYRPAPEVGTRLAKQLIKLGQCLAIVLGKPTLDKDCYRIMERVAFDTALGWNLDILRVLVDHYPTPVLREFIERNADLPTTTCKRRLEDMVAIKMVIRERIGSASVTGLGRPPFGYTITEEIHTLWKNAKVGE